MSKAKKKQTQIESDSDEDDEQLVIGDGNIDDFAPSMDTNFDDKA